MPMKMDFGVSIGRNDRIDQISELAIAAENWGFSHLGFVDSQNQSRDIYVMMAVAAQATNRIRLWQTVTVPATRHPSVTANATATVNELSGGRAFLGLGAGMNAVETMGVRPSRIKDLREFVEFTRKYMLGEEAKWKGSIMKSDWVKQPFKIYLNAGGPKSTELAGELANCVIFMGGPSSVIKWKMQHIKKGAARAWRNLSDIDIVVRSNIYVASSKNDSHGELVSYISPYAGLPVFDRNDSEIVSICS
jgi:5,10-methylenetetrahydromethanopterin reductase